MTSETVERKLVAILSGDVVGYSRLMAEDEEGTVRALKEHRRLIDERVRAHRGRVFGSAGDSVVAEFSSPVEAVRCAVEIQSKIEESNLDLPEERRMRFRIGVNLGDVVVEGENLLGDGVNIAARLQGLAEPGGLYVSGAVHEQVKRRTQLTFEDLGAKQLKNIPDPVRVYRVLGSAPTQPATEPASAAQSPPSIAVLPFVNMSADPDQEFFADGMSEELINALTQVEGLRVIARTSAFSFKGTNADIATIGAKLKVSAVVEGSVRKAGNRLRIAAQLIDVAGGHHLWSEVYDRSLDDVFEIQDEIARTIVTTIRPKLLPDSAAPLVKRSTESQEAYELYLRAVDRSSNFERWDTRTAIEMLKDATSIDPGYADAWARLALACTQMDFVFEPDRDWNERAEEAVHRAFELDPDNAEAQFAHGRMLWSPRQGFQNGPALRSLKRAREMQPGSHQACLWQSLIFQHVGLLDEAWKGLAAALALEPDDPMTLACVSQTALSQGRYDEAQEYMDRALAVAPTFWLNHVFSSTVRIYRDDFAKAEDALRTARQVLGDQAILDSNEALLWAKRREKARAEEALARALQDRPSVGHDHHRWHYAAAVHALLGRPAEAIAQIRRASLIGLPNYPGFRDDPHFASLREEPEWKTLMSDLEREDAEFRREFGHRPRYS